MSKRQERQRFIRYWQEKTGEKEIDMHKVAEFAKKMGWQMPTPPSEIDLLAKLFADDAKADKEVDKTTGRPYRVYHALPVNGQLNLFVYVNITDATPRQMRMSLVNRREQMVSDGVHIKDDQDHWNAINPKEEQIDLPMDLTLDIDIRRASDEEDDEAA